MNLAANDFANSVRMSFPFYTDKEQRFYCDFRANVRDFTKDYPNCTYEDLEEYYGNPKDIVSDFYDSTQPEAYLSVLKRSRYIATVATISILFITAVLFGFIISEKIKFDSFNNIIDYSDTAVVVEERIEE
jgi:hypothetical protein